MEKTEEEEEQQQKKISEAPSPFSAKQTPSFPATPALCSAINSSCSNRPSKPVPKRHGRLASRIPLAAARRFMTLASATSQRTCRHCSFRARLQAVRGVYRSAFLPLFSQFGSLLVFLVFSFFTHSERGERILSSGMSERVFKLSVMEPGFDQGTHSPYLSLDVPFSEDV